MKSLEFLSNFDKPVSPKAKNFKTPLSQNHGSRGNSYRVDTKYWDWKTPQDKRAEAALKVDMKEWSTPEDAHNQDTTWKKLDLPEDVTGVDISEENFVYTAGEYDHSVQSPFYTREEMMKMAEEEMTYEESQYNKAYADAAAIIEELNALPVYAGPDDPFTQDELDIIRDHLYAELDSAKYIIDAYEDNRPIAVVSPAEAGVWSKALVEAFVRQEHDMYGNEDEEDLGLDTLNKWMRERSRIK